MPSPTDSESVGTRIRDRAKLEGLTLRGLALRANVSYSLVTKVTSGHAPATPALIASAARALHVSPTELTGQPYMTELQQDRLDRLVEPLRIALDSWDLPPQTEAPPRSLDEIQADVTEACLMMRCAQLGDVAARIPALLDELAAVRDDHDSPAAAAVLAQAYRCVYDVASKWGFRDLALSALDRVEAAGRRSGDPLWPAYQRYQRSVEQLRGAGYEHGLRLLEAGRSLAAEAPRGAARTAVEGQLHLSAAVILGRSGRGSEAEEELKAAEEQAATGDPAVLSRQMWLGFCPANVHAHRVSMLADQARYAKAIAVAREVAIPDSWHASRRAHFWMDVARAQSWVGDADGAFGSLQTARKIAPQQTRYHPTTRETVKHLIELKRRAPETLVNLAHWVGV